MSEPFSPEALISPGSDKPAKLRELIRQGTIPVPGAFNAISAKILEDLGYPAIYVSGAGLHNGVAGYPDVGMLGLSEMAEFSGYIARSVNVPVIADADTGFGEAVQVFRTVQEFERVGVAGIHIEDQAWPKRCGHLSGKQVIPIEAMEAKIRAAVKARRDPNFLIIARVDSRAVNGMEDAILRGNRYLEAGADMIFAEAMESEAEFGRYAREVPGMLLANMTEFGKSPYLSLEEFRNMNYRIVIFPMTAFRVMMKAVRDAMGRVLREGTQIGILDAMTSRKDLYELIHYRDYEGLDGSIQGF